MPISNCGTRKRRRYALTSLVSALLLGSLLVACTSTNTEAPDPCMTATSPFSCQWDRQTLKPDHPCRLLRLSEIESVLGEPLQSIPGNVPGRSLCFFSHKGDLEYAYRVGSGAQSDFTAATKQLRDQTTSLGTQARWDSAKRILHVRTRLGYLLIEIPPIPQPRDVAVQLAQIALPRIDREEGTQ